jgi:BirA family biotin operon repressor/biotin-[acetyl-CoA-carboxylase] ligase
MKDKNGLQWIRLDNVPSTNEYAKNTAFDGDVAVLSRRQTGGKGTKGRIFESLEGGVYLTLVRRFENLPSKDAFKIMAGVCTAVCKTLVSCGVKPVVKWPNDVHVGGKKICGILIENVFSGNRVCSSLVGIGLNVRNVLPKELGRIATTMAQVMENPPSVEEVRERLIENLAEQKGMDEYLKRVGYLGRNATVIFGDKSVPATLLSVDEEGGLWAEIEGEKRRFAAAEVSLRL